MSCVMYLFEVDRFPQDLNSGNFSVADLKGNLTGYRGRNRYLKQLKKFPSFIYSYQEEYFDGKTFQEELIEGHQVAYAQGWFFKKRFLNRKYPFFIATTKKGMINFMNKTLKFNSPEVVKVFNNFVDKWESNDDMIFYCAF